MRSAGSRSLSFAALLGAAQLLGCSLLVDPGRYEGAPADAGSSDGGSTVDAGLDGGGMMDAGPDDPCSDPWPDCSDCGPAQRLGSAAVVFAPAAETYGSGLTPAGDATFVDGNSNVIVINDLDVTRVNGSWAVIAENVPAVGDVGNDAFTYAPDSEGTPLRERLNLPEAALRVIHCAYGDEDGEYIGAAYELSTAANTMAIGVWQMGTSITRVFETQSSELFAAAVTDAVPLGECALWRDPGGEISIAVRANVTTSAPSATSGRLIRANALGSTILFGGNSALNPDRALSGAGSWMTTPSDPAARLYVFDSTQTTLPTSGPELTPNGPPRLIEIGSTPLLAVPQPWGIDTHRIDADGNVDGAEELWSGHGTRWDIASAPDTSVVALVVQDPDESEPTQIAFADADDRSLPALTFDPPWTGGARSVEVEMRWNEDLSDDAFDLYEGIVVATVKPSSGASAYNVEGWRFRLCTQ